MSTYATRQRGQSARLLKVGTVRPGTGQAAGAAAPMLRGQAAGSSAGDPGGDDGSMIDLFIDRLVDRVAAAVVARLENGCADHGDEWFDSAQAAEYLGLHRDTLRRLAAARAIPTVRAAEAVARQAPEDLRGPRARANDSGGEGAVPNTVHGRGSDRCPPL
jgi:hypothetical protein